MARTTAALLVFALCAALGPWQAQAHGGGLHDWDWTTPDHVNYTRIPLASAANFTFYNASTSSSFLPGDLPFFPSYALPATTAGNVSVWQYLDSTCRDTNALQVHLNLTAANGAPIAHEKLYFWGMTGNCSTGVLDVYKHNASAGASRLNMVWAAREGVVTNENGTVWGTAPNVFFPRRTATAEGPALSSILIGFAPDVSPFLCADLKWVKVDAAAWAQKIKDCKPTGGEHRRRLHHSRAALRQW